MINKILVANRGEIAIRICRACRNLKIPTVAIYSESDKDALHVQMADEAICIGSGAASESYLNMDRILSACEVTGANAIHPGYGFLSENPEFVRRCENQDIIFIGPSAEVMELMGEKSHAKQRMKEAKVPVIPGSEGEVTDAEEALKIADQVGFPIMIKASAGGGGKGMREVYQRRDFLSQFHIAQQETIRAFADNKMYLERLITNPHHVEVQILADHFGNVISLGERDCSIQRNHQKLIEESPSTNLGPQAREKMFEAARRAAETVHYLGAGTIEFIVDENQRFYFMEMNTRIQVEHPVTEMVTGIDLVEEQIRIANGEEIPEAYLNLPIRGCAIECRINAEDPMNHFIPSPGKIGYTHLPGGCGVRCDTGIYDNYVIPTDYDSLIAKVIVHADTREMAIAKMQTALDEMVITGIKTNLDFQYLLVSDPEFQKGHCDTAFIDGFLDRIKPSL